MLSCSYAFISFTTFHMLSYTFICFHMLSYDCICFHTLSYAFYMLSYAFCMLLYAFTCFYMLLLDKLSEQQEEEEMLPLCLTGFYLRKPVKRNSIASHPHKTTTHTLSLNPGLTLNSKLELAWQSSDKTDKDAR